LDQSCEEITILDRILLLATGLLAAYQVVKGIDQLGTLAIISIRLHSFSALQQPEDHFDILARLS